MVTAELELIITFFLIVQVELLVMITLLIVILIHEHKKRHRKKDPLVRHAKEYLAEGYTAGQVKDKLVKLGFERDRADKILSEIFKL